MACVGDLGMGFPELTKKSTGYPGEFEFQITVIFLFVRICMSQKMHTKNYYHYFLKFKINWTVYILSGHLTWGLCSMPPS